MSRCRSCNAFVRWVHTETGAQMPLDADPVPNGNIHVYDGIAYVLDPNGQAVTKHRANGNSLYLSHFVTCPNASEWRKKR